MSVCFLFLILRTSADWVVWSQEQLDNDFVFVPSAHIRFVFGLNNALYAPTYLELRQQQQRMPPPYKPMLRPRNKGKGKRVQKHDDELEREMAWVGQKLDDEEAKRAEAVEEEARMEAEGGIECGCCFSEYPFVSGLPAAVSLCAHLVERHNHHHHRRTRWCSARRRTCSARRAC